MSEPLNVQGSGPRLAEQGGTSATRSAAFASSLSGGRRIGSAASEAAIAAVDLARRDYAEDQLESVLSDLSGPSEELASLVAGGSDDSGLRISTLRLAAAAASLRARAAARIGRIEMARGDAERAVALYGELRRSNASLAAEEIGDCAMSLYWAERIDEATEAMAQAISAGGGCPELLIYKGVIEYRKGKFEDAVASLESARQVTAPDLQRRRLETLAPALTELGPERLGEAVDAYTLLASMHFDVRRFEEALASIESARAIQDKNVFIVADRAEILRRLGRIDDAIAGFEEALTIKPDFNWALARKGEALRHAARYEEALTALRRATEVDPKDVFALSSQGETLRSLNRFEEALVAFDAALAIEPNYAWVLGRKGEALRQLQRYEEALTALQRAAEVDPKDVFALASQGETLRSLDRFEEALVAFDAALAIEPNYAWVLGRKGEALRQLQRYEEALKAFESGPGDAWVLARKGETLRMLGRYDESVNVLDQALAQAPDDTWALTSKADALRSLGRLDDAIATFDAALVLDPSDTWALARKGEALYQAGRYPEALQAFVASPNDSSTPKWKGETLRILGRFAEAIEEFDNVLAKNADDAWVLASKGAALRSMGEAGDAEQALRRAIEIQPDYLFAMGNLVLALTDQRRNQEALAIAERVLKINPTEVNTLEGKAIALMQLDDLDQAIAVISRRLEVEAPTGWARGARGVMLVQIEAYTEAAEELERGIELDARLAWIQSALCHCYRRLALHASEPDQRTLLAKSEGAGKSAVELEPEDPDWHRVYAETLWRIAGRRAESTEEFGKVLELVRAKDKLEYHGASSAGWAAFRLASTVTEERPDMLAEAERFFVEALATRRDSPALSDAISVQFDLALMTLSSGRTGLALREYDRVLDLTSKLQPGLRRGVAGRALDDLHQLMTEGWKFKDERHVVALRARLERAHATWAEAAQAALTEGATEAQVDSAELAGDLSSAAEMKLEATR